MKLLLIGQAPGHTNKNGTPLMGKSARFLAKVSGKPLGDFRDSVAILNVLNNYYHNDRKKKGLSKLLEFPLEVGKKRAKHINLGGRVVLLLGTNVAKSFEYKNEFLKWRRFNGGVVAIFPHPSAINRWWNHEGNKSRAEIFLQYTLNNLEKIYEQET